MATRSQSKLDLEICLEKLELPGRAVLRESAHVLNATLIWPRIGIAKRSWECEVRLKKGLCDKSAAPWHEKILFREITEGHFALQLDLTVSLTRIQLRTWRRQLMGYVTKAAGELADDVGFAGELAEAPLKVASKEFLAKKEPELYATGAVDLNAADFAEASQAPVLVEIPLVSALDITKLTRRFKDLPVIGKAIVSIQ